MEETDELRATYLKWTVESLETLDDLHAQLAADGDGNTLAEEIFAIMHNVKGMGASFGFPLMTEAGSLLCDYFRTRPAETRPSATLVAAHLKAMHVIIDNNIMGDGGEAGAKLIKRLEQLTSEARADFPAT